MSSKNEKIDYSKTTQKSTGITILTSGCHFQGKLYCKNASRIGGRVDGQIISEGLLIIEEGSLITATIKTDEIVIQGYVKGELTASGRVDITKTSRFEGDISTPTLVIHEGAKFNGRCFMTTAEDFAAIEKKSYSPFDEKPVAPKEIKNTPVKEATNDISINR